MQPVEFGALTPAERARVIYSQARAEVADRLWQAAIGSEVDRRDANVWNNGGRPGLDALLTAIASGAADAANIRAEPVTCGCPPAAQQAPSPAGAPLPAHNRDLITGLGPNAVHAPALQKAAIRTGIPAPTLAAIIDAEAATRPDGSWNLHSRNPRSSAAGLGQFLSGTWIGMAERKGSWLHDAARQNGWLDTDGQVRPDAKGPLLALRYNAEAAINSIADYAGSNIGLMRASGIQLAESPAALAKLAYLGHHLGPGDALRFLKGGLDETRAAHLLKAQIGASRAAERIDHAGSAAGAHRQWLTGYMADHIRPDRFSADGPTARA